MRCYSGFLCAVLLAAVFVGCASRENGYPPALSSESVIESSGEASSESPTMEQPQS